MYENSNKEVFKMSIPIFFELLLQLLVGNIDQIMVAQYSQNAVAAISNGNQLMNIIIVVLNSMSVGTTIMITRCFGTNKPTLAKIVANVSMYCLAIFSIIITIILFLFSKNIFLLLNVPQEIMNETISYTLIVGSFILIQSIYMVFSAILRSYNLMKEITIVAVIMNTLNIIGNAILINGWFGFPQLGIAGAAISTDISKLIGLILIFIIFLKKTDLNIYFLKFKFFSFKMLKKVLLIALPSGGEALSYQLSQLAILTLVNTMGTQVITARSFCNILANITYVYSIAIGQATQILVGYLYGKKDFLSIIKRIRFAIIVSLCISVSATFAIYLGCDYIMLLFTQDNFVISLCANVMLIEILLEIGRSINITMVKSLVATQDVNFPVIICMFSAWAIAVGLSYLFGIHLKWGLLGVWLAMAIDECFRGLVFIFRFKQGNWRKV